MMNRLAASSACRIFMGTWQRQQPLAVERTAVSATQAILSRYQSSVPLRRPPQRHHQESPENRENWRTHVVSLELGDYSADAEDEDPSPSTTTYSWQDEEMELAEEATEFQQEIDQQKQRWLENAKPPIRKPVIDERGRAYGRGGRKQAAARVWIQPGMGHVVVNRQDFVDYFKRSTDREHLLAPLCATRTCGKFDITAVVSGGGLTGQAGAIRHGLARALNHYNPDVYRPPLKRLGYLTRDPRKVERKKVGHLKARKKPQWVKR